MNIQKVDLALKGLKLNIDFIDGYLIDNIAQECNNTFKEVLGYDISNIYDKHKERVMTVLFKRRGGIEYKIGLKPKSFNFYVKIEFYNNIENIFSEIEKAVMLFYEFVYKMQDCNFKIISINFTKCLDVPDNEVKEYFDRSNAIAQDGIGLHIKHVQNEKFNLLLNSYFLNKGEEEEFINNVNKGVHRLYNISYK